MHKLGRLSPRGQAADYRLIADVDHRLLQPASLSEVPLKVGQQRPKPLLDAQCSPLACLPVSDADALQDHFRAVAPLGVADMADFDAVGHPCLLKNLHEAVEAAVIERQRAVAFAAHFDQGPRHEHDVLAMLRHVAAAPNMVQNGSDHMATLWALAMFSGLNQLVTKRCRSSGSVKGSTVSSIGTTCAALGRHDFHLAAVQARPGVLGHEDRQPHGLRRLCRDVHRAALQERVGDFAGRSPNHDGLRPLRVLLQRDEPHIVPGNVLRTDARRAVAVPQGRHLHANAVQYRLRTNGELPRLIFIAPARIVTGAEVADGWASRKTLVCGSTAHGEAASRRGRNLEPKRIAGRRWTGVFSRWA